MKTAKYIRVSTNEQNIARQENKEFIMYTDKCSGIIPFLERPQGKKVLSDIKNGKIAILHVHSIDRLGRNAMDIQNTIDLILNSGVNIIVDDLGVSALLPDKTKNSVFKMITDLLANVAQMERDSIKKRQAEGIAIAKAKGVYSKSRNRVPLTDSELIEKNKKVVNCLELGMSLNKTAESTGLSVPTVIKVKKALKELNK